MRSCSRGLVQVAAEAPDDAEDAFTSPACERWTDGSKVPVLEAAPAARSSTGSSVDYTSDGASECSSEGLG